MNSLVMQFRDEFSKKSEEYQQFRPHYPRELFAYLSAKSKQHHTAWDCATGNGQSAICLADHFDSVIGTDASEEQINNATQKKGVRYHARLSHRIFLDKFI